MTYIKSRGFTIVEILVVMSVVGILMALVLSSTVSAQKTSRDGRRKADLEQMRSAIEMCKSDTNYYPAVPLGGSITCGGQTYLQAVPSDPSTYTYSYTPYDPLGGTNYVSYSLCAHLEIGSVTPSCPTPPACTGICGPVGSTCNYKVCNP